MLKALVLAIALLPVAPGGTGMARAQGDAQPPDQPSAGIILPGDENVDLDQFLWIKRPLVIFADSPADPRFVQQMEYIAQGLDDLAERDVVVLIDTDPKKSSSLRERLRPRGFSLVLIGKDGVIYLRKPLPWSVREISRVIDKMPIRQEEIRERRGEG